MSTAHLLLAMIFLAIAVVLATTATPGWGNGAAMDESVRHSLRAWGPLAAGLVLAQSLLGGTVRHLGAGLACPDVPLCLGEWVPPLTSSSTALHFAHRVLGVLTALLVLAAAAWLGRPARPVRVRAAALVAALLVVTQLGLGFLSVTTTLGIVPVSSHTLVAAALLADLVLLSCWGWSSPGGRVGRRALDFAEPAATQPR
jgi:heme A synthase